jgi:DNA polymerase III sliding clamp (beta) subunit (PCNA family)
MKIAVTKEALLEGLQRIQNVVSTRPTKPQFAYEHFKS